VRATNTDFRMRKELLGRWRDAIPLSLKYGRESFHGLTEKWRNCVEISKDKKSIVKKVVMVVKDCLEIMITVKIFRRHPVVEWRGRITNIRDIETQKVEQLNVFDFIFKSMKHPTLRYSLGARCTPSDFKPKKRILRRGSRAIFSPGGGRSSSEYLPFFNLELDESGVIMGIGWTGEWIAEFKGMEKGVHVRCGLKRVGMKLRSRESFRLPLMMLLFWSGDYLRGQNLLRSFILEEHTLRNFLQKEIRVAVSTWGGEGEDKHLRRIRLIGEKALPIDCYWVDAEWYGDGIWWRNCGNWYVNRRLYPNGLKSISDEAHRFGMKFLLWFEIERVCSGTEWYKRFGRRLLMIRRGLERYGWPRFDDMEDPRWYIREGRRNQMAGGERLLNLGDGELRMEVLEEVSRMISELGVDIYRQDFNVAPADFWRCKDTHERVGETELRYVDGLYKFWDELLRRHRGLIIDNCASGGRRIDLETLSRSIVLWRSDYSSKCEAAQNQNYGLSLWIPIHSLGGFDIIQADEYVFRSYISPIMVFKMNIDREISEEDLERIRRMIDEYLNIREYLMGDFYPLTEYSENDDCWVAYQYHREDLDEGIVIILKRRNSPYIEANFKLHELKDEQVYCLKDMDNGKTWKLRGKKLMEGGFIVNIRESPGSRIIIYRGMTHHE